jgi:hypothetical protein
MSEQPVRLTFRNGGWVLLMTGIVLAGIMVWAIAPAALRLTSMPPGDNQTIESYAFDLSNLQIDRELVVPAMRHRNMSPVVTDPKILSPEEIVQRNNSIRDPLVVSKDLVVGVEIGGESRAYPLHFLHVHEIVNDTLGGTPIAIVWHWPSGHLAVFERTIDSNVVSFANSGLSGNGGMLFYPLQEKIGNERLFASMLKKSVTGEDITLTPVPHDVVSWKNWFAEHPDTTSLAPNEQLKKRYRKASPELYFLTEVIYFPTSPMPQDEANPKTPVIAVSIDGVERVYAIPSLLKLADDNGRVTDLFGNNTLIFTIEENPITASIRTEDGQRVHTNRSLWFAWHANHPDSVLEIN